MLVKCSSEGNAKVFFLGVEPEEVHCPAILNFKSHQMQGYSLQFHRTLLEKKEPKNELKSQLFDRKI